MSSRDSSPSAPMLTVEEAAELCHVCRKTIYRALQSGRLRGVKVGRLWRIPEDALWQYLGLA